MSQPYNRGAEVPAPGQLDASLGEFWVNNPWDIINKGHNLSAYERKRTFLNVGGTAFVDISQLSGADGDGDGRCAVAGDFRNNGQLDIVVRQAGGGPVLLYENHFSKRHYLEVSLRGTKSNRQGIGARLVAELGDRKLVREVYPINSFRSQAPAMAHFGLGGAERIDRLTIRWPSGEVQEIRNLNADRHVMITEGKTESEAVEVVVPGKTIRP